MSVKDFPETQPAKISHLRSAIFGSGSIGVAACVVTPQLLLLYYLTEILAIPAAWAGLAVLIPKLWEFFFDPTVGNYSDRIITRWGRRVPFLLIGALLFIPCFALLFSTPRVSDWRISLAIVTLSYALCTSAYSVYAVPFITLPGEVSDDPAERTRVIAWRIAFVGVGILVAGGLAPKFVQWGGGGRAGYMMMGIALSFICGITMFSAAVAAKGFPKLPAPPPPAEFIHPIRRLLSTRAYRWLWISYNLQMVAIAGNSATLPFVIKYVLHQPDSAVAIIFVIITAANLLSIPIWVRLRHHRGSIPTYRLATILCIFGSASLYIAITGNFHYALLSAAFYGIGQAGQQLLPLALLPDSSRAEGKIAGTYHAGLFTGIWVAGEKLGLALGSAFTGFLLGTAGYISGGGTQTAAALAAIPVISALVPAAIFVVSLIPLRILSKTAPGLGDHA